MISRTVRTRVLLTRLIWTSPVAEDVFSKRYSSSEYLVTLRNESPASGKLELPDRQSRAQ